MMVDSIAVLSAIGIRVTVLTGPFVRIQDEAPYLSNYKIDEIGFSSFLNGWLQGDVICMFRDANEGSVIVRSQHLGDEDGQDSVREPLSAMPMPEPGYLRERKRALIDELGIE